MNITSRDKKMLRFWPIIWPLFFFLIFRHHAEPDWWTRFFIALAIVIGAFAVIKLIPLTFPKRKSKSLSRQFDSASAFTLIELLVVIAIIGLLAALIAPSFKHFAKGDKIVSATRQMLDDCARARQLAIANRSTVYMVFINTNFWNDPLRSAISPDEWALFATQCPDLLKSTTVTQLYSAQLNGYAIYSLQKVGDQPGAHHPTDIMRVRTLPDSTFFAPIKFTWPPYPSTPFLIQTNFLMYGFLRTNTIPFPTSEALTNANYVKALSRPLGAYPTVCFIAFNYLGQLTDGTGAVLPYDEIIPLAFGSIAPSKTQLAPSVIEDPPGNSTNISYNLIHIDRLTGRARAEQKDSI